MLDHAHNATDHTAGAGSLSCPSNEGLAFTHPLTTAILSGIKWYFFLHANSVIKFLGSKLILMQRSNWIEQEYSVSRYILLRVLTAACKTYFYTRGINHDRAKRVLWSNFSSIFSYIILQHLRKIFRKRSNVPNF